MIISFYSAESYALTQDLLILTYVFKDTQITSFGSPKLFREVKIKVEFKEDINEKNM